MKANLRCGAVALLFVVGCNRPDADLFGADSSPSEDGADTGGSTAKNDAPKAGAGATPSGDETPSGAGTASGGTASEPATAGTGGTGGTAPASGGVSSGGVGGANPPDGQAGKAGGTAGTAGTPDTSKPADPVCGNGILEAGEACDDAAHAGKDGCDANCKVVCTDYGPGTLESEDHHCYNGYDSGEFKAAQEACIKRGAHLATISSAAENKLARSFVNNSKWLGGLEDVPLTSEGTGTYTWITGEAFSYTNWASKEPNRKEEHCGSAFNTLCFEHCIAMLGDGTWEDSRCDISDGYVCEWEPAGKKP
jgi:cysteine-rich repeat protein